MHSYYEKLTFQSCQVTSLRYGAKLIVTTEICKEYNSWTFVWFCSFTDAIYVYIKNWSTPFLREIKVNHWIEFVVFKLFFRNSGILFAPLRSKLSSFNAKHFKSTKLGKWRSLFTDWSHQGEINNSMHTSVQVDIKVWSKDFQLCSVTGQSRPSLSIFFFKTNSKKWLYFFVTKCNMSEVLWLLQTLPKFAPLRSALRLHDETVPSSQSVSSRRIWAIGHVCSGIESSRWDKRFNAYQLSRRHWGLVERLPRLFRYGTNSTKSFDLVFQSKIKEIVVFECGKR